MRPLRVTATLATGLACYHPVALDSLLAAQLAQREGYPPPSLQEHEISLDGVLQWHPAGFHHASQAHLVIQGWETIRWSRKTLPLQQVALLTGARKLSTSGRWKAYWMPLRKMLPAGMRLTWWAVGDPQAVARLLAGVYGVGAKRNVGHGWVAQWTVEEVAEDWSLLRPEDGAGGPLVPARPLPVELAPEGWWDLETCRRTYPYWRRDGRELLAVPPQPRDLADEVEGW